MPARGFQIDIRQSIESGAVLLASDLASSFIFFLALALKLLLRVTGGAPRCSSFVAFAARTLEVVATLLALALLLG